MLSSSLHLPLNTAFSMAQWIQISLYPTSFRLFQPPQQPEELPLFYLSVTLFLLTTTRILSPRYLYLKLLGLNSYFICVSIRLHIAFICRGKHLNTKLLKHNSQKCIQFLSLHRQIWHFSSAYMNNSFSFLKIMPFQKNFSGRNL